MRQFQLKTEPFVQLETLKQSPDAIFSYRNELVKLLEIFPQGGTLDEMDQQGELYEKLLASKDNEVIDLENAEVELLLNKLNSVKYMHYSKQIIALRNALLDAKKPLSNARTM